MSSVVAQHMARPGTVFLGPGIRKPASNCATHVSAGVGKPPLYGQAQAILPNAQRQVIHLPLGQNAEAGDAITVAFDLGHPGRLTIISLKVLN